MFKVICIDNKPNAASTCRIELVEGQIYDIYQSPSFANYYRVKGLEIHTDSGVITNYGKFRFIPLSNIDETELIKQREHDNCKV